MSRFVADSPTYGIDLLRQASARFDGLPKSPVVFRALGIFVRLQTQAGVDPVETLIEMREEADSVRDDDRRLKLRALADKAEAEASTPLEALDEAAISMLYEELLAELPAPLPADADALLRQAVRDYILGDHYCAERLAVGSPSAAARDLARLGFGLWDAARGARLLAR